MSEAFDEQRTQREAFSFRLLMDNVRDYAIFTSDAEGCITDWNRGAERILGYSADEAIGQSAAMIFTPEDRQRGVAEAEMEQARAGTRRGRALASAAGWVALPGQRKPVAVAGELPPLSEEAETALFRVAQEALTNALRHAQATQITITLHAAPEKACLRVADDGQGFGIEAEPQQKGLGLSGMIARTRQIGGEFRLDSQPGQGTSVEVLLALPA